MMSPGSIGRIKPRGVRSMGIAVRGWVAFIAVAAIIVPSIAFAAHASAASTSLTRYEQTDTKIVYLGTWVTFNTSGASAGSYKYADSRASALIWFTGTQLDLIATKGYTQGNAKVSVDGGTPVAVNLYNSTTLRKQKVYSTGLLSQGLHKVTVSWTGQKSVSGGGTRVNIDAVDVAGTLAQAALTTIEDNDGRPTYVGVWTTSSSSSASGGSLHQADTAGSAALVAFNGTDVRYVAKTAPAFGRVKLTLDGGSPVYADLYSSSTTYRKIVWSALALDPGNHVLRIEWTGQKNSRATGTAVNVDALLVSESSAPASTIVLAAESTTVAPTAAPETTTTVPATTTTTIPVTTTTIPATTTTTIPATTTTTAPSTTAKTVEAKAYCRGDGVTDDTANIAQALAVCNPGDTLHFAAGTYLGDMKCVEGVNVSGDGPTSWIKGEVSTAAHMTFTDLKMGINGHHWGGSNFSDTHNLYVLRCTFTGGPTYSSSGEYAVVQFAQGSSVTLHDALFEDCVIERSTNYCNGVTLSTVGRVTDQIYNVEFRNCRFMGATRIGFEMWTDNGTAQSPFLYPFHDVNLTGCTFEPCDSSAISYGGSQMGADDGAWGNGYSTIANCVIGDAGVNDRYGTGTHGIEIAGATHMTLTGNRVSGSAVGSMLAMTSGVGSKWHETGGMCDTYNVISGNVFDGRLSPNANLALTASHWTFTGNTVYTPSGLGGARVQNATESLVENNNFIAWNYATQNVSNTSVALWTGDCDRITFKNNTFRSGFDYITQVLRDYDAPTGPSTNIVFANNTFVKHTNDVSIYIQSGSSASVTGSVILPLAN